MIEWRDQGIVLSRTLHGENAAIVNVFTRAHGRHVGIVPGGASRRMSPVLQPGGQVDLVWRARLEDHMGTYRVEPLHMRIAAVLSAPLRLSALASLCATCVFCLPEREPMAVFQRETEALADTLVNTAQAPVDWLRAYAVWELSLLATLGFGLDLSRCALTGARTDLVYVSPRSGRAVSAGAAGRWAPRLLPLPPCLLTGGGPTDGAGLLQAFSLTGFFLNDKYGGLTGKPFPAARQRFLDAVRIALDRGVAHVS